MLGIVIFWSFVYFILFLLVFLNIKRVNKHFCLMMRELEVKISDSKKFEDEMKQLLKDRQDRINMMLGGGKDGK